MRSRWETREIGQLYRVRASNDNDFYSRKRSMEIKANFRRKRSTNRGGVDWWRQVMTTYRFDKGRWWNSCNVGSRSRRSANFVEMFASGRDYQGDRNRVSTVRNGLRRYTVNSARPRSFERYFCRQVNSVVNRSPRNRTTNSWCGQ